MKLFEIKQGKSVADLNLAYAGGDFYCNDNQLTSLVGAPTSVGGSFFCNDNKLTSLVGAPTSVNGDFYCANNKLTSLHNIHKQVKSIGGAIILIDNPIKSHVLGVLLIKGVTEVGLDNRKVAAILNKHLPSQGMRSVLEAQEELIDAGFEDFAQL